MVKVSLSHFFWKVRKVPIVMENRLEEFISLVNIDGFQERYSKDITRDSYFGFPLENIIKAENNLRSAENKPIAYLSMEYGLATSFYNAFKSHDGINPKNKIINHTIFSNMRIEDYLFDFKVDKILDLPIYSGGLGVLAGDTLKSAADLDIPLVAIGILWEKGYFKQNFWFKYGQVPEEMDWDPYSYPGLIPLKNNVRIELNKETLNLKLWKYYVFSRDKNNVVPLILLDADVEGNSAQARRLTDQLYKSSDNWTKIMQRIILGIGAIKALEEFGYKIEKYHLNEGHAAMAFVEKAKNIDKAQLEDLRKKFTYTCHTPVAAGHDRFALKDLDKVLPEQEVAFLKKFAKEDGGDIINLTLLLLNNCQNINAVSRKHKSVMHSQFPQYKDRIGSITNGVHIHTWLSDTFCQLFDKYGDSLGDYRNDPSALKNVDRLRENEQFRSDLWQVHQLNKKRLSEIFSHWRIKENVFTICWARRIAQYKRPSLIMQDPERLISIAKKVGQLQIIIAGKAHPADNLAGTHIEKIMNTIDKLSKDFENVRIVMLENYDIFFGKLLTSCVDVWLNNPLPPFEASGTSGMKAILNGVVQLTTLDGWVVEVENNQIGEVFGYQHKDGEPVRSETVLRLKEDSSSLYDSLENLAKLYYVTYNNGDINIWSKWIDLMINCIRQGAFFNTHRMVNEYRRNMWMV